MEEEDLEEIIEKKVQKRVQEEIEARMNKEDSAEVPDDNENLSGSDKVSRRDFLKKMGAGAAGAGALALIPSASAFNIKSSNPVQYFNESRNSNPNFKVDTSGNISGKSADVADLIADKIQANNKMLLPDQTASENRSIWVEKTNSNTSKLKVQLKNEVITLSIGSDLPDTIVDNFEDGSALDEYTVTNTSSGNFQTQSSSIYDGSYALGMNHDVSNPRAVSTSGLNYYPSRGDTVVWAVNNSDPAKVLIEFSVFMDGSNEEKGYRFIAGQGYSSNGGDFAIDKWTSSGVTTLAGGSETMSAHDWYELEVETTESDLTFRIYTVDSDGVRQSEIESITATDNDYTDGGIGLGLGVGNNTSGESYIDNIRAG